MRVEGDEGHLTEEELHDAAEGTRSVADRVAAEQHLARCAQCRSDVERIRALLADAGTLPRAIEPPHDLWPAIRSRVAGGASHAPVRLRRPRREYAWLAAAALFLIVASSAITTAVLRDERPAAGQQAAVDGASDRGRPGDPTSGAMLVRDEYDRLDRDLAARLEEQRTKLQPETIDKVEHNLRIIDRAIEEIREAMAEDPHNEALVELLKARYGQKTALLQQVSQS